MQYKLRRSHQGADLKNGLHYVGDRYDRKLETGLTLQQCIERVKDRRADSVASIGFAV